MVLRRVPLHPQQDPSQQQQGDDEEQTLDRERAVCQDCHNIVYSNPKIVVACVILTDDAEHQCLLGQRAIEPRAGYWGFPQGFMEDGETSRQAAVREAVEEMGAVWKEYLDPAALVLRCVYNVPGSVQLVYEARVPGTVPLRKSTAECREIAFFDRHNLPELCFPTVQWALDHCWSSADPESAINNKVQQKTKVYNAEMDQWSEEEDEL